MATLKQHLRSRSIIKEAGVALASVATLIAYNTDAVGAVAVATWGPWAGLAVAALGVYLRRKTTQPLDAK